MTLLATHPQTSVCQGPLAVMLTSLFIKITVPTLPPMFKHSVMVSYFGNYHSHCYQVAHFGKRVFWHQPWLIEDSHH